MKKFLAAAAVVMCLLLLSPNTDAAIFPPGGGGGISLGQLTNIIRGIVTNLSLLVSSNGAFIASQNGVGTNTTLHGINSSDGTPGLDTITGGITFKDGLYTSGQIFGTNWVTNAITMVLSNSIMRITNATALDLRSGPDINFWVGSNAITAATVTGLVVNTTGSGGLVRSNAPTIYGPIFNGGATNTSATLPIESVAYSIGGTNLPVQIDAQINAKGAVLLQSATNYANGTTNATIVRQVQLTAASNALVALAYSLGTDATNFTLAASNAVRLVAGLASTNLSVAVLQAATNYANAVTNSTLVRQTQLTAESNTLVALIYTIGANDTNYTLTASNNVRLVAGLASTNLGIAILQSATNYANGVTNSTIVRQTQLTAESNTLVALSYSLGTDATNFTLAASNNVRLVAGLASTNLGVAILQSATNYANGVTNATIVRQTQATALSNAVISYADTKQFGSAVLTNLVGTVARNVTNVVSLSTTNATSKPLTNSYTSGVLTLWGLEEGANISLTPNGSNIVIATTAAVGEANTGANLGAGLNTYDSKSAVSLRFNTISNGGDGITVSSNANLFTINANWTRVVSQTNATALSNALVSYANGVTNSTIVRQTEATALSNAVISYANSVTNSTIVRQTQLTTASNALVTYANGVTNSTIVRQPELTAESNVLVALAYTIGSNGTNYTLTASNNVRLVAGLAATNHATAVLVSATNYANGVTNATIVRQTQLTSASNAIVALITSASVTTNENQFGTSPTLTIKDGASVTNLTNFGVFTVTGTGSGAIDLTAVTSGNSQQFTVPDTAPAFTNFWSVATDASAGQALLLATHGGRAVITNGTVAGGLSGITTNANQFGASTTLTLKDGVQITNATDSGRFTANTVKQLANVVEFTAGANHQLDFDVAQQYVGTNSLAQNTALSYTNLYHATNNSAHIVLEGAASGGTDYNVTNLLGGALASLPTLFTVNGGANVVNFTDTVTNGTIVEYDALVTFSRGTNFVRVLRYWGVR